jgi:hypothetical protein
VCHVGLGRDQVLATGIVERIHFVRIAGERLGRSKLHRIEPCPDAGSILVAECTRPLSAPVITKILMRILYHAGRSRIAFDPAMSYRVSSEVQARLRFSDGDALARAQEKWIVTLIPLTSEARFTPEIESANAVIREIATRRGPAGRQFAGQYASVRNVPDGARTDALPIHLRPSALPEKP